MHKFIGFVIGFIGFCWLASIGPVLGWAMAGAVIMILAGLLLLAA